jgi:hypothetical protein
MISNFRKTNILNILIIFLKNILSKSKKKNLMRKFKSFFRTEILIFNQIIKFFFRFYLLIFTKDCLSEIFAD